MTRDEVIALAPPHAYGIFYNGNGICGFYTKGSHQISDSLMDVTFTPDWLPYESREWVATKNNDGVWRWNDQ
jgi:hypothetical protein